MNRYLTELIGTFFLVLTIGLTAASGTPLAPIAIGSMLMVMVYMGGHVSGAHYNPAVSLGVMLRGRLGGRDAAMYMAAQLAGAVLAALAVAGARDTFFAPAPGAGVDLLAAMLTEVLFTFALVLVVLNTATSKKTEGNSFYGLAIGFTVTAAAFAGGPISGGAFNPAVGLGPMLVQAALGEGIDDLGVKMALYLGGPMVGGVLAWVVFRMQEGEE